MAAPPGPTASETPSGFGRSRARRHWPAPLQRAASSSARMTKTGSGKRSTISASSSFRMARLLSHKLRKPLQRHGFVTNQSGRLRFSKSLFSIISIGSVGFRDLEPEPRPALTSGTERGLGTGMTTKTTNFPPRPGHGPPRCCCRRARHTGAFAQDDRDAKIAALEVQVQQLAAQIADLKTQTTDLKTKTTQLDRRDPGAATAARDRERGSLPATPSAPNVSLTGGRPSIASSDGSFLDQSARHPAVGRRQLQSEDQFASTTTIGSDLNSGTNFRRARIGFDGRLFSNFDYYLLFDFWRQLTDRTGRSG